ncbi:uncharacterized protein LOC122308426 [Carya illinoinensis]|uniref:uncharacterized protein LOC122308426 n=1 Tax=Carya illinoinensis TaxID=32201 RepID=UPI001C71C194|nr:uncharacterized protein LOC122308426 [Carya illinoinensis]
MKLNDPTEFHQLVLHAGFSGLMVSAGKNSKEGFCTPSLIVEYETKCRTIWLWISKTAAPASKHDCTTGNTFFRDSSLSLRKQTREMNFIQSWLLSPLDILWRIFEIRY